MVSVLYCELQDVREQAHKPLRDAKSFDDEAILKRKDASRLIDSWLRPNYSVPFDTPFHEEFILASAKLTVYFLLIDCFPEYNYLEKPNKEGDKTVSLAQQKYWQAKELLKPWIKGEILDSDLQPNKEADSIAKYSGCLQPDSQYRQTMNGFLCRAANGWRYADNRRAI